MTTASVSVEREDASGESHEIHLEVTGTHNPFVPARLHGHPENCSPAEGGDTEIENVKVLTTEYAHLFISLTDEEKESAKEAIESQANEASAAAEERDFDDAPDYYD